MRNLLERIASLSSPATRPSGRRKAAGGACSSHRTYPGRRARAPNPHLQCSRTLTFHCSQVAAPPRGVPETARRHEQCQPALRPRVRVQPCAQHRARRQLLARPFKVLARPRPHPVPRGRLWSSTRRGEPALESNCNKRTVHVTRLGWTGERPSCQRPLRRFQRPLQRRGSGGRSFHE